MRSVHGSRTSRHTRFLRVVVATALVAGTITATESAAGAAPAWRVAPSPSPLGPPTGGIHGVSCPTLTACFAVGNYSSNTSKPLIERWNGTGWSILPSPMPAGKTSSLLSGVSCVSASSCFAVGSTYGTVGPLTFIQRWNGKAWSNIFSPTPTGSRAILSSASCVSTTSCVAVGAFRTGSTDKTLAVHWDGTRWKIVSSPSPAGARSSSLNSVSCASATSCFAVGQHSVGGNGMLVERWNGTTWSIVSMPRPAGTTFSLLEGVSCASTTACFAVGIFGTSQPGIRTLVERWDGWSWSVVSSPNPAGSSGSLGLSAVSCSSATSCFAVGFLSFNAAGGSRMGTLTEQWDGTSWSIVASPDPANTTQASLRGASCATTTTCVAVGGYQPLAANDSNEATLTELWDGTSWSITVHPTGVSRSELVANSCPSVTSCFAVGHSFDGTVTRPLIERWNGARWSILSTPDVPSRDAVLRGVSCANPVSCFVVGSQLTGTTTKTLVERWNGTSWTIVPSPNPAGATMTILHGVSCPSVTSCFAVGAYIGTGTWRTFAQRWNGSSWASMPIPNPGHTTRSLLYAVSCSSPKSCFAVGTDADRGRTLTERWNGTSWTIVASPNVDGASITTLFAVSCVSATTCVAVGHLVYGESVPSKTVAEQWNGTKWRVIGSDSPSTYYNTLSGVSCSSATTCFAVGTTAAGQIAPPTTLIERLTGKEFVIVSSPNPAGSTSNSLSDVSCAAVANCTAVGGYDVLASHRTLVERYT